MIGLLPGYHRWQLSVKVLSKVQLGKSQCDLMCVHCDVVWVKEVNA